MPKAISILFGAAFTVAGCYAAGRLLLERLRLGLSRQETHLFAFLGGAAVYSLWLFVLASLHLVYDASLAISGIVVIALALWRRSKLDAGVSLPPLPRFWRVMFWAVYVPFAAVVFFHAMAPEWSPDGSGYHLGTVMRYYRAHGFVFNPWNMYAQLSQGLEMLFLSAWAFGRHSGAALVHASCLLLTPFLMSAFGRRFDCAGPATAAGLLFLATPVVMIDGASAYNDVAVAAVLFGLFYLLQLSPRLPVVPAAVLTGVLAGFSFGLKYTAGLAIPYALAYLLVRRRDLMRAVPAFVICAALLAGPWLVRNVVWTGNPVTPLMNAAFPNPVVHDSFEQEYREYMRNYVGLQSHRDIPMELALRGRVLGGMLGPLWLLLPLSLLALRFPMGRQALLAAAVFALPYATNIGTRFLIPALPVGALAWMLALPARLDAVLVIAHAVLSFPDVPAKYSDEYAWRITKIPFRQALRLESEDSYLSKTFAGYKVARMVESATPEDARIYAFTPIPDSYTSRDVRVAFQSALGERLRDAVYVALLQDFGPIEMLEFRFPRQPLTGVRLVQTAGNSPDLWNVFEVHVLRDGKRLPRSVEWEIRAQPNPWDVRMAFDNDPVTRWRSWARIEPEMFLEIDFNKPVDAEAVGVESSVEQHAPAVELRGRLPDGTWKLLSKTPVKWSLAPPLGQRRRAMLEFKRAGITHLLVQPDDFRAEDFRENTALWGIRAAGEVDGARVYEIE